VWRSPLSSIDRPLKGRASELEAIMTHVPYAIADIKVGERHRRDLGDINALAASTAADGLQPVVITPQRFDQRTQARKAVDLGCSYLITAGP